MSRSDQSHSQLIKSNIADAKIIAQENAKGPPKRHYHGCCAPWQWYTEFPVKRWRFLLFFIVGCLTLVWLLMFLSMPSNPQCYVYGGIVCCFMSLWAMQHFHILTRLTEQVERFNRLNANLTRENKDLRKDVIVLKKTEKHLSGIKDEIAELNDRLEDNIAKFQALDKNLRTISDSNIEGIQTLQKKSTAVVSTMKRSLIRHEKQILHAVFDDLESANRQSGLSREDWDTYWSRLPRVYYQRWTRLGQTFDEMAGVNGRLEYRQFADMVDRLAREQALFKMKLNE